MKKEIRKFQGEPPSAEDLYWIERIQDIHSKSLDKLEETSREMIKLNGILSTIYFSIISVAETFKGNLTSLNYLEKTFLILPLLFWICSIIFAVISWRPNSYKINLMSPDNAKQVFEDMVNTQENKIIWAYYLFIGGIVSLVVALWFTIR